MSSELQPTDGDTQRQLDIHPILDALRGLKFGSVNIIVQDGVIIQIDRTEKRRLRRSTNGGASNQGDHVQRS